jgi:hypothetical protein
VDFHFCADAWDAHYPCDVATVSPEELATTRLAASQLVDALTGHQFGLCTITLRPCLLSCSVVPSGWYPFGAAPSVAVPGSWWYWALTECATCRVGCSCGSLSQAELPYPVHDVITVRVDGAPVVTGAYRVDDNRWLVRTDGATWPSCNDLSKADTAVGTWSVTARYGQDPPQLGKDAVGAMTCELLKAFAGQDCRVPSNVVELVRQGVRIKYGDVAGSFKDGRTGIFLVDAFIEAVNPAGLRRRPRVFDVDAAGGRRVGT